MTIDNQLANNRHPRVPIAIVGLLAVVALSACNGTDDRPDSVEQSIPPTSTAELGSIAVQTPESVEIAEPENESSNSFSEFIKSEERYTKINSWVLDFADQLGTAAAENSFITTASSMGYEGNSFFSYSVNSTDGSYSFTFSGDPDNNKIGIVPDSIYVYFIPINGDPEQNLSRKAAFSYNQVTDSYDSEYITSTINSDGSVEKIETYSVTMGGVGVSTSIVGVEGGMSSINLLTSEAYQSDVDTNNTIQEYIDRALNSVQPSE